MHSDKSEDVDPRSVDMNRKSHPRSSDAMNYEKHSDANMKSDTNASDGTGVHPDPGKQSRDYSTHV